MPRNDDDFDEDDGPRRRPRDDEEDRPARARRPRDEDADEDRPARPRRRREEDGEPPRKKSNVGLVIGILAGVFVLCCGGLAGLGYWAYSKAKPAIEKGVAMAQEGAEAEESGKNLSKIGIALHNHNDAHGFLPQNTYDDLQTARNKGKANATGKPLLSWRVHLLPFLEEDNLWRQFKLDEPWDSPNNLKLLNRMPAVYGTPEANKRAGPGKTYYRGFSHKRAIFEAPKPRDPPTRFRIPASFPDGTANTIAVVEAGDPVEWTKPEDLDWSPGRPRPALGGLNPNLPFVQVLFMNASVWKMRRDVPDQTLRWLIDPADGNIIPPDWQYK
jgi:hypothetical protein